MRSNSCLNRLSFIGPSLVSLDLRCFVGRSNRNPVIERVSSTKHRVKPTSPN
ncbi:hypothetical protein BDV98DRAFT_569210 [Pterulicium gracile]|uniref:Uncharacterized protein n=1 Tax=Pterulicium gracile TaxID=1884261 RepID=A0A5C3QHG3_9AGAR|nr:hypothetical protein BDV98DRAFT_569210 [Pterula gracilis]